MDERGGRTGAATRRRFLAGAAASVAAGLAGCGDTGSAPAGDGGATAQEEILPTPTTGSADAPVTVAVYEDFACPHCATFDAEVFPQLRSEYIEADVVLYEHHDLPIPVDEPESYRAANAARAVQDAADDETFFEYAHGLFDEQGSLDPDLYESLADEVGVDSDTVRSAAVDRVYERTISEDRESGVDAGVQGTPAVFVDGQLLDGYRWDTVSAAVEDARPEGA